jgi:hypothetical protein
MTLDYLYVLASQTFWELAKVQPFDSTGQAHDLQLAAAAERFPLSEEDIESVLADAPFVTSAMPHVPWILSELGAPATVPNVYSACIVWSIYTDLGHEVATYRPPMSAKIAISPTQGAITYEICYAP